MNINKNISVWRGNSSPPTKYHLWIKEDGSLFVLNKYGDWVEMYVSKSNIDSIKIESVNPTNDTILASYELYVNDEKRGVTIDIPKDLSIKDVKMSTIDATLDNNGNIVDGNGSTALCISYIIANGTYKLVHIDYSKLVEENEFSDGLLVVNHNVKIKIDPTSSLYLTVSSEGIKLSGIEEDISDLAESVYYYHANTTITSDKVLIEKGVDNLVTLTAKSSFRNNSAKNLIIKNSTSGEVLSFIGSNYSKISTDTINDTTVFLSIADFDYNIQKTANVTVIAKYPIYTLGVMNSTINSSLITSGNKIVKSSPSGSYNITLSLDLSYFWICVPNDMSINKVTLSGFDVPMESPIIVEVTGKGTYKCYKSSNTNDSGSYTLIIS